MHISLIKIKNGTTPEVEVHGSKKLEKILEWLFVNGYIRGYQKVGKMNIKVLLRYIYNKPVIQKIEWIPHIPINYSDIFVNRGFLLIETKVGIVDHKEAIKLKQNGFIIACII